MAFPGPFLAPPSDLREWAQNGDEEAARWLTLIPNAVSFGVDDGEIWTAFTSAEAADKWLAQMEADAAEQAANPAARRE